jgi:serine/threonine protein kinase/tetratricopeptide (TPR) repeat protein
MIGQTVSHYKILEKLGEGGMGEVYLAGDTKLHRQVALKFLPKQLTADKEARKRFEHEAQAAAALNHPNIVTIHEIGEHEGQVFISMEHVEGQTLKELIAVNRLSIPQVLDIAIQIASGLSAAHEKGIVHRDIKPQNILVDQSNHVKIVDFGLAKLKGVSTLTKESSTLGTVHYMSPEQTLGKEVDCRADIWSLGAVIYEMLSGELPFKGDYEQAVIYSILNEEPNRSSCTHPDISFPVFSLVTKALQKAPAKRYQSTRELIDDLKNASLPSLQVPKREKSIVVLPFDNLSPDPENAFFADGLTEEIITELSRIRDLRVISRTSAMLFKGAKKSVPTIASELNVRYALEGSVRRAGNTMRITAQLIDAATDMHVWAERHTGTLEDIFDLQERLAHRIVDALKVTLSPEEKQRLAARSISDPRAYEIWLRARHDYHLFTKESLERGDNLLNRALAIVGDNSLLYAGLAMFHYGLYDFGISYNEETLFRAESYAAKAIELNPAESQALFSMGLVRYKRGDLQGYCRYARRAVELERNSDALGYLGFILAAVGKISEARRYAEEGIASDPLTPFVSLARAVVDVFDGCFDAALARFQEIEQFAPNDPLMGCLDWWFGQAAAYAGRDEEARTIFERAVKLDVGLFSDLSEVARRALLNDCDGVHGWLEAHPYLMETAKTDEIYPGFLANFFARVGDNDEALKWIEYAISWGFSNHRFLSECDRFLEPLRGDPRFKALIDKARQKEEAFVV